MNIIIKNYLIYKLYQFLCKFSYGDAKKNFEIKLKSKKSDIKIYPNSIRKWIIWYKNKKQWNPSNNALIIIDDSEKEHNVFYYKGLTIEFIGKNSKVIIHNPCHFKNCNLTVSSNCTVTIDKNFINTPSVSLQITEPYTSITIGRNCLFGYGTKIMVTDYHTIANSENKILNKPQNITIGNHVWTGAGCIILKGSYIPDNSIVGTQSVYTAKSYIPHSNEKSTGLNGKIFMGNPAKCVKQGDFTWHIENCTEFETLNPQISK